VSICLVCLSKLIAHVLVQNVNCHSGFDSHFGLFNSYVKLISYSKIILYFCSKILDHNQCLFSPMCAPTWNASTTCSESSILESCHQLIYILNFSTSHTLWRFRYLQCFEQCTPESPAVSFSIGFFVAFMMLGAKYTAVLQM
jgi:hypothetical protein